VSALFEQQFHRGDFLNRLQRRRAGWTTMAVIIALRRFGRPGTSTFPARPPSVNPSRRRRRTRAGFSAAARVAAALGPFNQCRAGYGPPALPRFLVNLAFRPNKTSSGAGAHNVTDQSSGSSLPSKTTGVWAGPSGDHYVRRRPSGRGPLRRWFDFRPAAVNVARSHPSDPTSGEVVSSAGCSGGRRLGGRRHPGRRPRRKSGN